DVMPCSGEVGPAPVQRAPGRHRVTEYLIHMPGRDREYGVERHDEQQGQPDDAGGGQGSPEQPVRLPRTAQPGRPRLCGHARAAYACLAWSQAWSHRPSAVTGSCSSMTPRRKNDGRTAVDIRLGGSSCSFTRRCGVTSLSGCMYPLKLMLVSTFDRSSM